MDSDPKDPLGWEEWTGDLPFWQHAFCGSFAGVMEHLSLFPLDTIKTRLQIESKSHKNSIKNGFMNFGSKGHMDVDFNNKTNPDPGGKINQELNNKMDTKINNRVYKSMNRDIATKAMKINRDVTFNLFKNITIENAKNSIRSRFYSNLFRGSNIIIAGCVPAHILYFTVYEKIKRAGNIALSGASATFCHDLVLTPADVIKQRLQLGCYKNSYDCLLNVLKNEGVNSLFRSLYITLFMNIPYHSLLVTIIHLLKKTNKNHHIDNYKHFIYAGIGGAVAGAVTTPFDVIKTRLQTQTCHFDQKKPRSHLKYKNILVTFENIYRKEGFRGFLRGLTTRVGMCTPSAAISWGTYETLKNLIKLIN